jgi:hypothetical protein
MIANLVPDTRIFGVGDIAIRMHRECDKDSEKLLVPLLDTVSMLATPLINETA